MTVYPQTLPRVPPPVPHPTPWPSAAADRGPLTDLLDTIDGALGTGKDRVTLGTLVDATGAAGPRAALLVPSLVALSPATLLFGVATACGIASAALALQNLRGHTQLWLPQPVRRFRLRSSSVIWVTRHLRRPFAWLDHRARDRWTFLIRAPVPHLTFAIIAAKGSAMPFLELVPLSATTGGAAISIMVLGLLLRNGLFVWVGIALACAIALGIGFGMAAIAAWISAA